MSAVHSAKCFLGIISLESTLHPLAGTPSVETRIISILPTWKRRFAAVKRLALGHPAKRGALGTGALRVQGAKLGAETLTKTPVSGLWLLAAG